MRAIYKSNLRINRETSKDENLIFFVTILTLVLIGVKIFIESGSQILNKKDWRDICSTNSEFFDVTFKEIFVNILTPAT